MSDLRHEWRSGATGEPVFLLLHGTGGSPSDLLPVARMLNPSAAVLAPAGPVSEDGAARWFRRHPEGGFDVDAVVDRTQELADFVRRAVQRYQLTDRRVVAIGFSNGANIAAALTLLRPDVLTEAVVFASRLPITQPPEHDLNRTRVLVSNGERDPIVPVDGARDLVATLRERGADVSEHWHSGEHRITRDGVRSAAEWLRLSTG